MSKCYPWHTISMMLLILTSTCRTNLLASGTIDIPNIQPGKRSALIPPASIFKPKFSKEVFFTISLSLRDPTSWAPAGHEVAWFQLQVPATSKSSPRKPPRKAVIPLNRISSPVKVASEGVVVNVSGANYNFAFNRAQGVLTSWSVNGVTLLEADPSTGAAILPGFWRPPTDNDQPASLPYWQRFGVDVLQSQLRSFEVDTSNPDQAVLKVHTFITPPILAWGYECETEYTISSTGSLTIDVKKLKPTGFMPKHVPRAGFNFRLPKTLDQVKWFGLGPGESYPDKKDAQRTGIWGVESVSELQTPYEVPQENANRMDTRWVTLTDAHGAGVKAVRLPEPKKKGGKATPFNWVASNHSIETLEAAAHPPDLVEEDATLLRLDYKVAGVGTAACGPGVREDLLVKCEEMSFGFVLESVGL